jgi:hypothetical protein
MMRRFKSAVAAAVMAGSLGLVATPAGAVRPTEPGNRCQRIGMATVKDLGVFPAIAKNGVDAGTLKALGVRGIDEVPDSTVFTLPKVLELHRTSPQLFPWCD